jgi:NAD+ kinase
MSTVSLLVNSNRPEAQRLAERTVSFLEEHGHVARSFSLGVSDHGTDDEPSSELEQIDLVGSAFAVSLGGDGTFLRLAPLAWAHQVPILGVNFGHLGYLLPLDPDHLERALLSALGGEAVIEERSVLSVEVQRTEGSVETTAAARRDNWIALNEVVLEKIVFGHTVRLGVRIDDEDFITYSSDGLLVATPTGSTAYNLSAGGPVISPGLRAMILTPVAPHFSLDRSLVLDDRQVVEVHVVQERPAALVVDGQDAGRLAPGSLVTCRVAERPIKFVRAAERGFASGLGQTLLPDRSR